MITLWSWFAVGFFALLILGLLPGIRDLIRPLSQALVEAVTKVLQFAAGYVLWAIKMLVRAHAEVVRHLLHSKDHFDPARRARDG